MNGIEQQQYANSRNEQQRIQHDFGILFEKRKQCQWYCRKIINEVLNVFLVNGNLVAEMEEKMFLQPIETAPKDGTWILLFGPSGYREPEIRCTVGCWSGPLPYPPYSEHWQTHNGSKFEYENCLATHWCPIPDVVPAPAQTPIIPYSVASESNECYYCPCCEKILSKLTASCMPCLACRKNSAAR